MIGIYFLIRKKRIVYIGQTVSFPYRVMCHASTIEFDSVRLVECDKKRLNEYEARWIKKFRPSHNLIHNPDLRRVFKRGKAKFEHIREGDKVYLERIK